MPYAPLIITKANIQKSIIMKLVTKQKNTFIAIVLIVRIRRHEHPLAGIPFKNRIRFHLFASVHSLSALQHKTC